MTWIDRLWQGRAPEPGVFAVVTLVTFGGAFLAFGVKPWGQFIADALMLVWILLVIFSGIRQQQLDRAANEAIDAPRRLRGRLQFAVRVLAFAAPLSVFLFAWFLAHQGEAADVVKGYKDGAILLMVLSQIYGFFDDAIFDQVARLRSWMSRRLS